MSKSHETSVNSAGQATIHKSSVSQSGTYQLSANQGSS